MTTPNANRPLPAGFTPLTGSNLVIPKRAVVSLSGLEKSGKTDWVLRGAPEPIFHLILDPNGYPTAQRIAKELKREIYTYRYQFRKTAGKKDDYWKVWESFLTSYYASLDYGTGTVLVDTGTEVWELDRFAHFGRESAQTRDYGPVNAAMAEMFQAAVDSQMNVVWIHKFTAEWLDGKTTGGYVVDSWKNAGFAVECNLEAYVDEKAWATWKGKVGGQLPDGRPAPWPFHIYIKSASPNMTLNEKDFTTDVFTYPVFLQMLGRG